MYQLDVPNEETEEIRWNNLESVVPIRVEEMDERDLLQIALDQICDFQRQLQQESEAADESIADESESGSDIEDDDADEDVPLCDVDDEVVVAGYEFCAQEALRFLIEDEQLVPSHPIVQQLNAHLATQDREMDFNQVLVNYLNNSPWHSNNH